MEPVFILHTAHLIRPWGFAQNWARPWSVVRVSKTPRRDLCSWVLVGGSMVCGPWLLGCGLRRTCPGVWACSAWNRRPPRTQRLTPISRCPLSAPGRRPDLGSWLAAILRRCGASDLCFRAATGRVRSADAGRPVVGGALGPEAAKGARGASSVFDTTGAAASRPGEARHRRPELGPSGGYTSAFKAAGPRCRATPANEVAANLNSPPRPSGLAHRRPSLRALRCLRPNLSTTTVSRTRCPVSPFSRPEK